MDTAPVATYHIAIWDNPVTYACLLCHVRGLDLEAIVSHGRTSHAVEPVPTDLAAVPVCPWGGPPVEIAYD